MSIAERQQIEPGEELDLWVHWERGPMLVEDVRGLPRAPMIVVEGTTVPADQTPVLFLDRPSAWRDDPVFVHFAEAILENARSHDVPVLTVEGSVEETIAAVEEYFAEALARGPKAQTMEERRALTREANEALVFQVRTGTARPWATETPETQRRNFICECDDPDCRAVITVPVAQFERAAAEGAVLSCE